MKNIDVVILTESRYISQTEKSDYVSNIFKEEGLLQQALEKQDLTVLRKDWACTDFDWSTAKCIVFRSTWDYFDRFDEFKTWLDKVEAQTSLINSASQIRWNMDKHYLRDFENKGIRIVESQYLKRGESRSLNKIISELNWQKAILKPTIAGAARHTYKITPENIVKHEAIFAKLMAVEDMMLQPFQNNIELKGEVSFVLIDGEYTHSVLKKAKSGDFRVQDDFGGSIHEYHPSNKEIAFAEKVVEACSPLPAYARVDVMWDNFDELSVSEVELIEPELWFRLNPSAAEKLATVIANRI